MDSNGVDDTTSLASYYDNTNSTSSFEDHSDESESDHDHDDHDANIDEMIEALAEFQVVSTLNMLHYIS